MVVTRNLINKNIAYTDVSLKIGKSPKFGYSYLSNLIDTYKNLFISNGAKKGQTVVIGNQASISQIALVFACAELGLTVVISAQPLVTKSNKQKYNRNQISNKLKLMLPIDFFILTNNGQTDKYEVFHDICNKTILLDEEVLDDTPNSQIWADEDTVFLKCTSSGTTDTPKVITHTHKFFSKLIIRNSRQFYGDMGMISNLAHGSSPAVYFLPGLLSDKVTHYINFLDSGGAEELVPQISNILELYDLSLDHLLMPYTKLIDSFFDSGNVLSNCVLYTLSIIKDDWLPHYENKRIKDIISIFGTNETSGPFFINQISDLEFHPHRYKTVDDFYEITVSDNRLLVTIPVYNRTVDTGDMFVQTNSGYEHLGRNNLYRINDLDLDLEKYNAEIKKTLDAQIVLDITKESIYLAIWEQKEDPQKINKINTMMKLNSKGLHYISKHDYLQYDDFLSGIKLDMEMLREYFRKL